MRKIRIKFIKGDEVKFLGHLDILRTFNRAIRRSSAPVEYSKGFNPHPIISFALPLSVGVTSEGEFVDMETESDMSPKAFVEILNKGLPAGLKALSAEEVDIKANAMAEVRNAKYKVTVTGDNLDDIEQKINELMSKDSIVVLKETKSGAKDADIKPDIIDISILSKNKNTAEIYMELCAGSISNLKPDFVVEGLKKYCNVEVKDIDVHRIQLGL